MSDYVQVDALGRVGLAADPDALLTVGARISSPTDADILAGAKPWAWYDATDWNGDGIVETPAEDTRISTWGDKANYPNTDRSMASPTNLGMRYYNRVRQAFEAKRISVSSGLPGSVERGNGYLSQLDDSGPPRYYYSRLNGITFSPSFSAWTIVAVVGMDSGSIHTGMLSGVDSVGGRPGPRIMVMGDGTAPGGYGSFDLLNTNPALDYPNPAWEQFQSIGNISMFPSRAKFTVRVQSHTAGNRFVICTVDGASGTNFDADNLAQYQNHPFWYKSLGTFQETAGGVFTLQNLYYAEVMIFDHVVTTAELNLIHAYLSTKYHKNYVGSAYDLLSISSTPEPTSDYVHIDETGRCGLSADPTAQLTLAQRSVALDFLKVEDDPPVGSPGSFTPGLIVYEQRLPLSVVNIFTVPYTGGIGTNLTPSHSIFVNTDQDPVWSADGTRIAYATDWDYRPAWLTRFSLHIMDANGSNDTQLTFPGVGDSIPERHYEPAFSPDGLKLIFTRRMGTAPVRTLWTVLISNGTLAQVSYDAGWGSSDTEACYSPDGAKIVFSSNRNGEGQNDIFIMDSDGANLVNLTLSLVGDSYSPTFSPDESTIMWAFYDFNAGTQLLYTMNVDGSSKAVVSGSVDGDYNPSYSSDGLAIVFYGYGTYNADGFFTMTLGSPGTRLDISDPSALGVFGPSWQVGVTSPAIPATARDYVHVDHEGLVSLSATPDGTTLLQMKERTTKQDFLTLKDTL